MKLTKIRCKKLKKPMPIEEKPAKISNYKCMSAMIYIIEIRFTFYVSTT